MHYFQGSREHRSPLGVLIDNPDRYRILVEIYFGDLFFYLKVICSSGPSKLYYIYVNLDNTYRCFMSYLALSAENS